MELQIGILFILCKKNKCILRVIWAAGTLSFQSFLLQSKQKRISIQSLPQCIHQKNLLQSKSSLAKSASNQQSLINSFHCCILCERLSSSIFFYLNHTRFFAYSKTTHFIFHTQCLCSMNSSP